MASRINMLETEYVKLKEDYKNVTKHFGQKSIPLPKVCMVHYDKLVTYYSYIRGKSKVVF